MMLTGRIWKGDTHWLAECDAIGSITQGRSRNDACAMLADLIQVRGREELQRGRAFSVEVTETGGADDDRVDVLITSNDPAALAALVLKHQRKESGLSLADVAAKLGASSRNAYARYEQGKSVPTIDKFLELLRVVAPQMTVVIGSPTKPAATKRTKPAAASRRKKVAA